MNGQLLHSTLRELQAFAARPRLWLVFAIVVALFAATGPFGTFDRLALPMRTLYWLVLHAFAWTLALAAISLGNLALAGRLEPPLVRMLASAAAASIPIGGVISLANTAFFGKPLGIASFPGDVATALPVTLALAWLTSLSMQGDETRSDLSAAARETGRRERDGPVETAHTALVDRLSPDKRGCLVRLEVQDHYVLVVTENGREMLLMRLGDAMREVSGGMQVHRSHWIAFDSVEALERDGGRNPKLTLRMKDGAAIPVSRSYAADVRARFG